MQPATVMLTGHQFVDTVLTGDGECDVIWRPSVTKDGIGEHNHPIAGQITIVDCSIERQLVLIL